MKYYINTFSKLKNFACQFLSHKHIKFVIKIILGLLITILLLNLYAIIVYYTDIPEVDNRSIALISTMIGASFTGFLNSSGQNKHSWIKGGFSGFYLGLILLSINFVFGDITDSFTIITLYHLMLFISSSLGYIVGMNLRKSKNN